ncbi:MAG: Lrp/AsnC family transcriptional regulator [Candidatus Micrarchaeota archaeon]
MKVEQMPLDGTDRRIISEIKRSSAGSYRKIAVRVGIHPATLIERLKRLEREKVILGYTAFIDYSKLGYEYMATIQVRISKGKMLDVQTKISKLKGVVSVYDVTGDYDSLVRVVCKSRSELSRLVKKIHALPGIEHTNTQVILNVVKDGHDFVPE